METAPPAKTRFVRRLLLIVAPAIVVAAVVVDPRAVCRRAGSPATAPAGPVNMNLREVVMTLGARRFTLEVAETDEQRRIGLMNRPSLPRDRGMLFVFDREEVQSFWMKNTHIPLDIIFVDAGGRVVDIQPMRPRDLATVWSSAPAQYAIEVNRGAAAEAGVKVGDVLDIPAAVKPSGGRRTPAR